MAQNELNPPFSGDPAIRSSICARCGKTAEMHLALLGDGSHRGESFCLSCGEALIHDLRVQYSEQAAAVLPAMGLAHKAFLHSDTSPDEIEGGIIFWEGHGWSSDGPFAGA